MPTFATPNPVHVEIELYVANVSITAQDRADTVVEILPSDPDDATDVETAALIRAELSGDTITVKGQKFRKYVGWNSGSRSVDMTITVPTGSSVTGRGYGSMVNISTAGSLAACEFRIGMGRIFIEEAGPVKLRTTGDIMIDRAVGDVNATTSTGSLRIGEAREGVLDLKSAMGEIEIGVAEGTAALVDARTSVGTITSHLANSGEPAPGTPTVKVRARASVGDIVIHRS